MYYKNNDSESTRIYYGTASNIYFSHLHLAFLENKCHVEGCEN